MKRLFLYLAMRGKVRLAHRGDLALNAIGDLLMTIIGLFLLDVIYRQVPTVRGWSRSDAMLAWGFGEASLGLFWMIFNGLYTLNRTYILEGELDRVLLRPLDPYLQILLDHAKLADVPMLVLGLGVVVYAKGAAFSVAELALLPVFVVAGAFVVGGVLTAFCALGFWMHHQGSAVGVAYQLTGYGRYPLDFLPRPLAVVVCTVLPFAFSGFLPATFYMNRPEWNAVALAQPLVGTACLLAGYAFFRLSLRRYDSSGS